MPSDNELITVCDYCFQASCWQGIFMCERARFAGTAKMSRLELARLNLEHSSYWKTDSQLADEANKQAHRFNNRPRSNYRPRIVAR